MKTKNKKPLRWILILALMLTTALIFSACNTSAPQIVQETETPQQNEVYLPSTGSDPDTEPVAEIEPEEVAYPDSEQEVPSSEMVEPSQGEAYPEPEQAAVALAAEPYPSSEIEPTQGPQPTPRGDELFATNPTSFSLASGQVQLVELFAFW